MSTNATMVIYGSVVDNVLADFFSGIHQLIAANSLCAKIRYFGCFVAKKWT